MTKRKYLRELRKALGRIPESEKEELVEYYAEMIDESYERGKTTREIFATLESPQQVASDYFNANEGRVNERRRRPTREEFFSRGRDDDYDEEYPRSRAPRGKVRREKRKPNVLLTVLLFPLWFPLAAVAFALALAVSIVVLSLLVADVALVVAFSAGGLYCLVTSFGLFPSNAMIALAQIGAAFVLFGLAMMFEVTIKPLSKGVGAFFRLMFRREGAGGGAIAQTHWLRTFVIGLVFLLIGGGAAGFGYHALGDDWHNLAALGEFTEVTEEIDLSSNAIDFQADNLRVNIVPSTESNAKLVYTECEELPLKYSQTEPGVFSLKCGSWSVYFWEYTKQVWKHGILFSAVVSDKVSATLYLPTSYEGDLKVEVNNGMLTMEVGENPWASQFGNVSLSTDNGMICVEKLNAKSFTAQSNNGYVKLNGVIAADKMEVSTHNGMIGAENLKANTFTAESDNGLIKLDGVTAESKIEVSTHNGALELKDVMANDLSGKTHNGAIRCNRIAGTTIKLHTSNGAITGSINGKQSEYKISAKVSNGSCNLQNTDSGTKTLDVTVSNGSINVSFMQ